MIGWLNDFLMRRAAGTNAVLTSDFEESAPTQQDKPSPKSSLSKTHHSQALSQAYPISSGFTISAIANTNSMEPFLDDSDLVVLEDLTGKWRDQRLAVLPFAPGQIVIYSSSAGRIIHTLKERTTFLGNPAWIIMGHNNFFPDMVKVPESAIVARLVCIAYGRPNRDND